MRKKILTLVAAIALTSIGTFAQNDNPFSGGTPPKAELGKCYAKCYIPTKYGTETETVVSKQASTKYAVTPARFESGSVKIMTKSAYTKLVPVAATFKSETEEVLVKAAYTKISPVAAVYKSETETILIKEKSSKWVMKKDKNCMSANPDDCFVACFEEIPEKYSTYTTRVLVTPATTKSTDVPAKYKTITRRVVDTPATTKTIDIPAQYTNVKQTLLTSDANASQSDIAQQTKSITKRVLETQGEYTDWREVLCGNKFTSSVNRQIQESLRSKGYDIGVHGIDDIIGKDTRAALMQFQRDNNLPVGNLNLETLDALGVKY